MLITALMFLALEGSRFTFVDTAPVVDNNYSPLTKDNCDTGERLRSRCRRMLAIEKAVAQETMHLDARIDKNEEERRQSKYALIVLARKQKKVALEAASVIKTLKAQMSTALLCVFEAVRSDSEVVRTRILNDDLGQDTQAIENEMIEILENLTQALEK